MKIIMTLIGARPQFVKAAVLSRKIKREYINSFKEILVHTGQHYDSNMSDLFFQQMEIPKPDYYLGLGGGMHGEMTGKMMIEFEKLVLKHKPDYILIYGDTNSTLAGALVGAKLHIPVIHIEAGLRSFDNKMPEEINRIVADHISEFLFCPTETAVKNLDKEGIYNGKSNGINGIKVQNCGDIMYEAFVYYSGKADEIAHDLHFIVKNQEQKDKSVYERIKRERFHLLTLHRDFNVDSKENLTEILKGLSSSGQLIVFPIHPRTLKKIGEFNLEDELGDNILMIEPVGYFEMLWLELNCAKVITDSGGVQKEAYFARKPCITIRDHTEWLELVEQGVNILCETRKEKIKDRILRFTPSEGLFNEYLYGTGNTSEIILENL